MPSAAAGCHAAAVGRSGGGLRMILPAGTASAYGNGKGKATGSGEDCGSATAAGAVDASGAEDDVNMLPNAASREPAAPSVRPAAMNSVVATARPIGLRIRSKDPPAPAGGSSSARAATCSSVTLKRPLAAVVGAVAQQGAAPKRSATSTSWRRGDDDSASEVGTAAVQTDVCEVDAAAADDTGGVAQSDAAALALICGPPLSGPASAIPSRGRKR
jgi:hypothetical protein